jgi:hypothetical protein
VVSRIVPNHAEDNMRGMIIGLVSLGFVMAGSSRLSAQEDVRAVIEKAVKAHGGEANLNKHKAGQTRAKGIVFIQGNPFDITEEATFHLPNKLRSVQELQVNGMAVKIIIGFDGSKAWLNVNGKDLDMKLDMLGQLMKEQEYLSEISRLTKLNDKAYELSSLGETKVQDKAAVGVRVSSKGHKDVNLYFDKASGLLVKVEHRTVDFDTEKEMNEERIFLEYQKKDGLMEPRKAIVNHDGKKHAEMEIIEVKYLDEIDDTQFSKP